jgi:hypothetical protein
MVWVIFVFSNLETLPAFLLKWSESVWEPELMLQLPLELDLPHNRNPTDYFKWGLKWTVLLYLLLLFTVYLTTLSASQDYLRTNTSIISER